MRPSQKMIYAGECARVSQQFAQATTRYGASAAMCIAASAVQPCCGAIRYRLDHTPDDRHLRRAPIARVNGRKGGLSER